MSLENVVSAQPRTAEVRALPLLRAVALPSPQTEPLTEDRLAERLGALGMAFLGPLLNGVSVYALECSQTRVDVGLWWRHAPLWIVVHPDAVILAAWGRSTLGPQPWLRTLPMTTIKVTYNHVIGALVLRDLAVDDEPPPPLLLDPGVGYQLWADIRVQREQVV